MGLIQIPRGISTKRGYAPADIARSASESAAPHLWRHLAFAYIYVDGVAYDVKSRMLHSDANISRVLTRGGPGVDHAGRVETGRSGVLKAPNQTVTMLTVANPPATGRYTLICQRDGNNDNHLELRAGQRFLGGGGSEAFDGSLSFLYSGPSQPAGDGISGDSVVDGDFHAFFGVSGGAGFELQRDFSLVGEISYESTQEVLSDTADLILGGLPGTATIAYQDQKLMDLGWSYALPKSFRDEIAADWWVWLRPRPLLIPVSGTSADVTGSGSVQAQSSTATGTGIREVTGSGTPQAQDATATATGEREITGSGTPSAQAATASGTGEREITGSATVQSQDATATGSGGLGGEVSGSGSASAQDATATGSGSREIVISAAVQARDATASGTGEREITGSATVQSQSATASGTDIVEVIQNRLPPHLGQSRLYRYLKS